MGVSLHSIQLVSIEFPLFHFRRPAVSCFAGRLFFKSDASARRGRLAFYPNFVRSVCLSVSQFIVVFAAALINHQSPSKT